jgi:uncharacterized cofD-like protein
MPADTMGQRASAREHRLRVVAFGGGHGLGASLRALVALGGSVREPDRRSAAPLRITAVVTVGDDGGSSGRLREQRGILPPGDLRQALAALAGDDPRSVAIAELFQHRFDGAGDLAGHPVGNLMLCGLLELHGDPVAALDAAAAMVAARGRVLPMSREPVAIEAAVRGADPRRPEATVTVRGQHEVAVSPGRVVQVRLRPAPGVAGGAVVACPEALAEIAAADWLLFGPGSWYTSVIPHLLVPQLAAAIRASPARRVVVLNLATEPETAGLTLPAHLTALTTYAPDLRADVVLGDATWVTEPGPVRRAARLLGAELALAPLAAGGGQPRHDPAALAAALLPVLAGR